MAAIRRTFQFSDTDESPRRARKAVRQALLDWACGEDLADTAELLASELATNAVVHATDSGGAGYTVEVELAGGVITVGVTDRGKGEPSAGCAGEDDEGGRGLAMVRALSRDWGVQRCPEHGGKRVYFTLATATASAPGRAGPGISERGGEGWANPWVRHRDYACLCGRTARGRTCSSSARRVRRGESY